MALDFEAEATTREKSNATLMTALARFHANETRSSWELDVINDAEHGRWTAILNEDAVAELPYRFVSGRVVLLSTWVAHPYRNQRVATELIARVLDEIRASGKTITIICPVVGEFIARNPSYADLIDPVHPGDGAYPRRDPADGDLDEQLTAFERDLA
jgi:predicted GNAT family acetyltransferase